MRVAIAIAFVLLTSLSSIPVQYASSHSVPADVVSGFFRVTNEQISANNVTVGDTIEVMVELQSLINTNLTISEALIVVSKIPEERSQDSSQNYTLVNDQWRIANATYTDDFVLAAGETMPFSINITALDAGNYHLHPAFEWHYTQANGTLFNDTNYGKGEIIEVTPSKELLQRCQQLEISQEECSQTTILQKTPSQIKLSDEDRQSIEDQQNQTNNMIYMIGIGAAIAGIVAFLTLRIKGP